MHHVLRSRSQAPPLGTSFECSLSTWKRRYLFRHQRGGGGGRSRLQALGKPRRERKPPQTEERGTPEGRWNEDPLYCAKGAAFDFSGGGSEAGRVELFQDRSPHFVSLISRQTDEWIASRNESILHILYDAQAVAWERSQRPHVRALPDYWTRNSGSGSQFI